MGAGSVAESSALAIRWVPWQSVQIGAGLRGKLALEEAGDHVSRRNVVLLVAFRARRVDFAAGIGDIGFGRADVLVVRVGHARDRGT